MIKLSLCVPIYGVEKEIPRFLASLEKNLCDGTEVILVDDGTKDNSGKIADAFAEKHPAYVRVIHKPNGGVSSARNAGLDMARGEYVLFCDPDDQLADDHMSAVLKAIDRYDSPDVIYYDYSVGTDMAKMKHKSVPMFREGRIDKETFVCELAKDRYVRSHLWNKVIKRALYGELRFNEDSSYGEDFELLTELMLRPSTFVYLPKTLYRYMLRPNSLTGNISLDKLLSMHRLAEYRYERYRKVYPAVGVCHIVESANKIVRRICEDGADMDTTPFERVIKDNIGQILFGKDYPFNIKKRSLAIYLGLTRPKKV